MQKNPFRAFQISIIVGDPKAEFYRAAGIVISSNSEIAKTIVHALAKANGDQIVITGTRELPAHFILQSPEFQLMESSLNETTNDTSNQGPESGDTAQ